MKHVKVSAASYSAPYPKSNQRLERACRLDGNPHSSYFSFIYLHSQISSELSETIKKVLANHGPLVKARPAAPGVGAPLKRQSSVESALPTPLGSQVSRSCICQ